ncbi:MAG TPA: hypothetical protein VFB12_24510 [Ktedonobacteraceae bacterium]|nr:hypothetical protein [Ktedonobacteraceae bacterium]
MLRTDEQGSEVARLLGRITAEYEAAKLAMTGPVQGTAQHNFITARMERIGDLHQELQSLAGEHAMALVAAQLDAISDSSGCNSSI